MDRTAYKNRHIKEYYDRINLVIPKGEKNGIKKICSEIGGSVNEYLYQIQFCKSAIVVISKYGKWLISASKI